MLQILESEFYTIDKGTLSVNDGVSSIQVEEFSGDVSINSVILPSSLITIDDNAFSYTPNLKTLVAYGNIQYLGENAFKGSSIETISFKQDCRSINNEAFSECPRLRSIICRNLGDLSLGEKVFFKCTSLREVTLSNSIIEIKKASFFRCENLRSIVLPGSLQKISSFAFAGCKLLSYIELPPTLKEIESNAFDSCTSLVQIELPENLEYLDKYAFNRCTALNEVNIPRGLKVLNMEAFSGCTKLKRLRVSSQTEIINQDRVPNIDILQS